MLLLGLQCVSCELHMPVKSTMVSAFSGKEVLKQPMGHAHDCQANLECCSQLISRDMNF